jgi:hypothetical protein
LIEVVVTFMTGAGTFVPDNVVTTKFSNFRSALSPRIPTLLPPVNGNRSRTHRVLSKQGIDERRPSSEWPLREFYSEINRRRPDAKDSTTNEATAASGCS